MAMITKIGDREDGGADRQDLCSPQLPRRTRSATQQPVQFVPFVTRQIDAVADFHRGLLGFEAQLNQTTWRGLRDPKPAFSDKQG